MLEKIISSTLLESISWTLLHSIWQITIIGIIVYLILQFTAKSKANLRYNILLSSIAMILSSSILTFLIYSNNGSLAEDLISNTIVLQSSEGLLNILTENGEWAFESFLKNNYVLITGIWFAGFLFLLLRILLSYTYLLNISNKSISLSNLQIQQSLKAIQKLMNLPINIKVNLSDKISSPIVVGWIKPIIIFPIAIINQINLEETEAIIAHELAHIKRNDFLINIIQTIVESIFYYHPIVWWISSQLRVEREHSCDDLAIHSIKGNSIAYAKTLLKIETLQKSNDLELALSFTGKKEYLLNRITRIINSTKNTNNMKERIFSLILICLISFGIAYAGNSNITEFDDCETILNEDPIENKSMKRLISQLNTVVDTIPKKRKLQKLRTPEKESEEVIIDLIEEFTEHGSGNFIKNKGELKEFLKKHNTRIDLSDEFISQRIHLNELKDGENDFVFSYSINGKDTSIRRSFNGTDYEILIAHENQLLGDQKLLLKDQNMLIELELQNHHNDLFNEIIDLKNIELKRFNNSDIAIFESRNFPHQVEYRVNPRDHVFRSSQNHSFNNNIFRTSTPTSKILHKLYEELLIKYGEENKIEITGKKMKINGKKQSKQIWLKYKNYYEKLMGSPLTKSSKIEINDYRE